MIDEFKRAKIPMPKIIKIGLDCIERFNHRGIVDVLNEVKKVSIETDIFQMHCLIFRLSDKVAIDLGGDGEQYKKWCIGFSLALNWS